MFTSNFIFLEKEYPSLYRLVLLAEKNVYEDPSTTLTKLRIFSEKITLMLADFEGVSGIEPSRDNQHYSSPPLRAGT